MRKFLTILILLSLRAFTQVNAPDLRCLQVLPNGNVKLTWLAPPDPSNQFSAYQIYFSTSSSGPFNLVASVGAIATLQYTDVAANANLQSCYYYMLTKYGAGGVNTSANSTTLQTIFLNCLQNSGSPAVKLLYNPILQPKLPSTSANFSLVKEYPIGTWNNLSSTTNLNYSDTISVCTASINYQATLQDNSGCFSSSNIQGGIYKDQKAPNQPFVDSISVLPNGNTVLAWQIPNDLDIIKYQIAKNTPSGIITSIATLNGINSTSYGYTVNVASTGWVGLYVSAIDSCNNISTFDNLPRTMFLTTTYDSCSFKTNLSWTPYGNMPKGILEYRIYYSVNGSAFLQVGATTQTNFTHSNVQASANCCYFIRVINTDKTITSSSNRVCFFSKQPLSPSFVYITSASVLDKKSVQLKLFIDTSKKSSSITIYRSTNNINFNRITNAAFNNTPFYTIIDDNADTKHTFYYYKAVINDACGNERIQSQVVKTILLKVQDDNEEIFIKHLCWTNYLGFNGGVSGYNIYRVVNDIQNTTPIASKGPTDTTFTDDVNEEAPNGSKIEYVIEALEGIGDSYGFAETSKSNLQDIYIEGRLFVPSAFAPNGKNKVWLPITHFIDKTEYNVSIFNRWGVKLFETNDDTKGWDGINATPDVYVYLIDYKNARGEYKQLKGTVLLLE